MTAEKAEELFRQVAAFASFGFAKSHAAAFARTAYESAFLKLFYPAQFLVGLINAQPMGFYPVEVLVNDAKRHGVAVLPVDVNAPRYRTTTEWVGLPGEPLPDGAGIAARPEPVRSSALRRPDRPTSRDALDAERHRGLGRPPRACTWSRASARSTRRCWTPSWPAARTRAWPTSWNGPSWPRRSWSGSSGPGRSTRWAGRGASCSGSCARSPAPRPRQAGRAVAAGKRAAARAGRWTCACPPTEAPDLPPLTESERLGDAYAVLGLDARRQVVGLFRPALDGSGRCRNARPRRIGGPGRSGIGGLVVTRQHPMTAKGTVFLALEDETGMVNVTLWPDTWARLRGVVRRHALLLVDGDLQREGSVVNVVAHEIRPLPEVAARAAAGGPRASARWATPGCGGSG